VFELGIPLEGEKQNEKDDISRSVGVGLRTGKRCG
jgi:hypothetical protein